MNVKLKKPWKNHPKGTVLTNVSSDILTELVKLGVVEKVPQPIIPASINGAKSGRVWTPKGKGKPSTKKAVAFPSRDKMAISPITETKKGGETAKSPLPYAKVK